MPGAEDAAQIRAEIDRVTFRNEENGWTVLKARLEGHGAELVTATGHFAAVQPGQQFEFFGAWSKHPQYGLQFKVERLVPVRPTTRAAIERYLASGSIKGIGPKTAERIVDHFGDATFEILDSDPKRLAEVTALGAKKRKAIIAAWSEHRSVADVMMFLSTHGVAPAMAARIMRQYGPDAIAEISANPYRLADDIHGIGFLTADRIARSMGIRADSPERLRAAVVYQIQQAEEKGHCFVTHEQLKVMLTDSLAVAAEVVEEMLPTCLKTLSDVGAVVVQDDPEVRGDAPSRIIYRSELLICELNVARRVRTLLDTPLLGIDQGRLDGWVDRYCEAAGTPLAEEQLLAVRRAAINRVFILTGGPGVGKTTTANTIIRLLKAMGKQVALAAPTGRAAQRLTEVAAQPAKTIHRLLEWQPHLGGFARHEDNTLPVDVVIVDEASMLDIRLADALLRAVPDRAQLILIGDIDQLPSVGPGNVLRDLIESNAVPCVRLTTIFRQAATSRIVMTAHAINQGEGSLNLGNDSGDGDCHFLDRDGVQEILESIEELIARRIPEKYGFDPVTDVQVLTPMNRGDLGTQSLNERLQRLLNPPRPEVEEYRRGSLVLRPGDKVIQSVNNYDLGVFNGDIGFVRATRVQGGKIIVAFADDRTVTYDDEAAQDLRLAYAVTVHKAQGSEFPVVIIPSSMQHYVMLQRNLFYTALTRARKLAFFVGAKRALAMAVANQQSLARQTRLVSRVRSAR